MRRELEAIRADVRSIGQPRSVVPQTSTAPYVPRTTSLEPTTHAANPLLTTSPTTTTSPTLSASGSATHSGPPGPSAPATPIGPPPVAPVPAANTSGGRPVDGTQSMIIPPRAVDTPPTSRSMTSTPAPTNDDPLSQSTPAIVGVSVQHPGQRIQETMDMYGSQLTDRTFTPGSTYRRIDQREAARKLANFL